ncbi:hypothetical protein PN836_016820 [Ningiella sp. W23]|uniref:hypothetical protein n=1 Tax=Ningiella sp. W23 TaxID=3023715 RepID=UPI0037580987
MKYFFYLSIAPYAFVYFYAAWIYDGFSMPVAIVGFIVSVGLFYYLYKAHMRRAEQQQIEARARAESAVAQTHSADRNSLSLWKSPLPYIGLLALLAIYFGFKL